MILTDDLLKKWGGVLPVLPESLYSQLDKYQLPVREINEQSGAEEVILSYLKSIGIRFESILEATCQSDIKKLYFSGGLPMTVLSDGGTYLFRGSAFLNFAFRQPQKNVWLTTEQIEHFNLSIKEDSEPVKLLWQRKVKDQNVLLSTDFYNISDVATTTHPPILRLEDENDWPYSLQSFTDDFDTEVHGQTTTLVKRKKPCSEIETDSFYRNDSFLLGVEQKYALVIPDLANLPQEEFDCLCLVGLSVFVARSSLITENKDLPIANLVGFLFSCQLSEHLFNKGIYQGSTFHLDNAVGWLSETNDVTERMDKLARLYDKFFDKICEKVLEIGVLNEALIRDKGLIRWLADTQNLIRLQTKYDIHPDSEKEQSRAEVEQFIHRSHVSFQERFKSKLESLLKQKGLAVQDGFSIYFPAIYAKFDSIMAERNTNLHPDEEKFYQIVEAVFLPGLVAAIEQQENLVARWQIFEKEVGLKSLPDPEKDLILRVKFKEFLQFKENIFFKKVDSAVLEKQISELLDSSHL